MEKLTASLYPDPAGSTPQNSYPGPAQNGLARLRESLVVPNENSKTRCYSRWVVLADEVGVGISAGGALGHHAPEFLRRLPQDLGGVPAVFGDFREAVDLFVVYRIHSSMGARTAGDGGKKVVH